MIWWCRSHEKKGNEKACGLGSYPDPCRMVEALLIVEENGEWPEAALNAVAAALGTLEQARWALDALASVDGDSQ